LCQLSERWLFGASAPFDPADTPGGRSKTQSKGTTVQFVIWNYVRRLLNGRDDERGATLVEYALLVALIAVVCIVAVSLIGGNASNKFSQVGSAIQ
jgi:pilus assembly protein Flp/PilA